jgi:hypothetical protein
MGNSSKNDQKERHHHILATSDGSKEGNNSQVRQPRNWQREMVAECRSLVPFFEGGSVRRAVISASADNESDHDESQKNSQEDIRMHIVRIRA